MRKLTATILILLIVAAPLAAQQPLPIRRVVMYKNGMAYVLRSGEIRNPLSLTFHPDEMNDVLKTFTAWNPTSNSLYSVGYTTGVPSSQMLARFPFDLSDPNLGLGQFLQQIKGAAVRLELAGGPMTGKLVTVREEDRAVQAQTHVKDFRLTVLEDRGSVQSVWLADVRSVELPNTELAAQLRSYLEVLAEGRQDVTRQITVYPNPAAGPANIAYVLQFPVWKTSYRLDLAGKDSRIQGWTQIDNPTGESWSNVDLTLVSGMPTSFIMDLYSPLYTQRQTIAPPSSQVAAPRNYEAGVAVMENRADAADAPAKLQENAGLRGVLGGAFRAEGRASAPASVAAEVASSVGMEFQAAEAIQNQDYFEYRFPFPIQLASRQSALLPFLNKPLKLDRISIYNEQTNRRHPFNGAAIENNSGVPLEPGPVTFYQDGRYAGEAVLDYLTRGEKRLVSYGVDYDIEVAPRRQSSPEVTTRMTASRGSVFFHREVTQATTYQMKNKGRDRKSLVIEHPRGNGNLKDLRPEETTANFYRFRQELNPDQSIEFPVTEVLSRSTAVSVRELDQSRFEATFVGVDVPAGLRAKLQEIVRERARLADLQRQKTDTDQQVTRIFEDQNRVRENLKSLRETREDRDLRERYIRQLDQQESQITELRSKSDQLSRDIATQAAVVNQLLEALAWN